MAELIINRDKLTQLLHEIAGGETEVFAPVLKEEATYITKINQDTPIHYDFFISVNSVKEAIFPRYEPILKYKIDQEGIQLEDIPPMKPIVLFGGHPCDAASLMLMEKLFGWDYNDHFYLDRRNKTIVITLACNEFDKDCFCTSLGYSPHGEIGSDILLESISKEAWIAKAVTDRGKAFIEQHANFFNATDKADASFKTIEDKDVAVNFDKEAIKPWIEKNFESEEWQKLTSKCWSCAACTYVCPTCHCFDITDDASMWSGLRTKNWDACTMPIFTLHASQHNPREAYYQRYRQRIAHKYSYYVDKFKVISCTGCGRCSRVCGAGMNILEILTRISKLAKEGGK